MRTKPANWDTYLAETNSYYAVRIDVYKDGSKLGESYTYEDIISAELSQTLYGDVYGIGNTVMNQLTLTIDLARKYGVAPKDLDIEDYFPKLSAVRMSVWVANESNSHATLPSLYPTFTTDKPEYDKESGFMTVVAYDGMYLLNVIPFAEGSTVTSWDSPTLRQVAKHLIDGTDVSGVIETDFGGLGELPTGGSLTIDDLAPIPNDITMESIPYGFTVREILGEIALAGCGNWTIVSGDKLRLVAK